jgi:hypothetical protein
MAESARRLDNNLIASDAHHSFLMGIAVSRQGAV